MKKYHLAMLVFVTSCSNLPTGDDLKTFSDASTSGAKAVKTAISSAETVASHYDQELAARDFMNGRPFASIGSTKKQTTIAKESLAGMLTGLDNLAAYTAAVGKAADRKNTEDLEAAANNLGKATAGLVGSAQMPGSAVAGAAITTGARLAGYAMSSNYANKIVQIIRENDAIVAKLVVQLQEDLDLVVGDLEFQVGDYQEAREGTLREIRRQQRLSKADLYHEFHAAKDDIASNQSLLDAAQNGKELLDQIRIAHHKLASGEPDIKQAMSRFEASAGDLASLITEIKKRSKP